LIRLLAETHIDPAVVDRLASEGVDIVSLRDWRDGEHRDAPDDELLEIAATVGRVLVTYDIHTIPPLLKDWAIISRSHAGVIFVTGKSVRMNDIGALLRGLRDVIVEHGEDDWQDRAIYLSP
jgi:predicted nuclease of predicted toxin-antitoxin system